jgi:hypothetical protein
MLHAFNVSDPHFLKVAFHLNERGTSTQTAQEKLRAVLKLSDHDDGISSLITEHKIINRHYLPSIVMTTSGSDIAQRS